ncbi:uncharacterized protein LOC108153856 [Drosophila miranda]|uniref:uncharacterized protein LOC108153856 n=1 Tax=Drosophila miranda TaxID=7229 RepID=UPI00143F0FCD|nr:uncharacterized protein LOC108153856 [Drosophila miranda]
MEIRVGVGDLMKMGTKLVGHKIVQYRLATKQTKVISTRNGQVKGLRRKTLYDEELYYAFEGIPFAQPPLGELRFRAPEPAAPWQGIRDCTYPRAKPMQKHFVLSIVEGSEDCLYLNVYAKKLDTEQPLPVLVWIYGGGFQIGEASRDFYSPDYFMKQDVILVTFNYRVGALGFLSLADRDLDVPGNAGLKDQVLALRWVRENISQFNGDANNITLMGESAGAASTHMMMTTEQTRGLFHKAIMQSGSMYSEWASEPRGNWAYRLACSIGYSGSENEKEVFRYLQRASASDLATHCIALITQEEKRNYVLFAFTPVVEPYVTSACVMPKPHREMVADAWGNDIPLIIGANSFEGLFSYQSTMQDADHMLSAFEALIPREVRDQVTPAELKDLIREFKISNFDDATRGRMEFNECLHLLSIKHFWHGIHRTVLSRLALAPTTPTYLYRFDFDSPHFNHFRTVMCGRHVRGVSHGDDVSYLFYLLLATKLDKSSMEYRTIERMIGMWTAFAANDNPSCPQISPVMWDALDTNGPQMCLNIGHNLEFFELPETKQLRMWDRLYDKQNNNEMKLSHTASVSASGSSIISNFWLMFKQCSTPFSVRSTGSHSAGAMAGQLGSPVAANAVHMPTIRSIAWGSMSLCLTGTTQCDVSYGSTTGPKANNKKLRISSLIFQDIRILFAALVAHLLGQPIRPLVVGALHPFAQSTARLENGLVEEATRLFGGHHDVQTESGPVVGRRRTAVYGDEYVSFERIPYALPPVGRLRFMNPLPVTPWTEPLDCTEKGPKPLQMHEKKFIEGAEDCLYLNVYARKLHSPKPLPLLVYFFGGGFEIGDATTDMNGPDYFMMRDVVVVTISYRVGALGFLSLNDPAVGVPGNAGLKDQLLGLQWISANAASFNADPNNVTAFGDSAGAASVHYLMLNPKAEGLFHKAILQSGNALCPWAVCPKATQMARRLADQLGMDNVDAATDAMILDYLQVQPGHRLMENRQINVSELLDGFIVQLGPTVEPYETDHCVLAKNPSDLLATAWGNKIPVLMGGTSFEGLMVLGLMISKDLQSVLKILKNQPQRMLPFDLQRVLSRINARKLGLTVHAMYFGTTAPMESMEGEVNFCEYISDKHFWLPIMDVIRSRQDPSLAPTYLYCFDYDSPTFNHERIRCCGKESVGTCHYDDHSYLWFGNFSWKLQKDMPEYLTIERMIDIVTTFAETSDPNCQSVLKQLHPTIKWKPIVDDFECLNISDTIKVMEVPNLKKLKMWEKIIKTKY